MNSLRAKYVAPTTSAVAFNCPHCGALAKQFWFSAHAIRLDKDSKPNIWTQKDVDNFDFKEIEDTKARAEITSYLKKMAAARPFFEAKSSYKDSIDVGNLWISRCFSCNDISFWLYNKLMWPQTGDAPSPNSDLPSEILLDYEEASTILNLSPRGAAALLRLCIQKLCKYLGEKGKSIDDDIASLVTKGLNPRIQKALDIVRVVGNQAVHPGEMNLKDDRATAEQLFSLVNLIADKMITEPKQIDAMFDGLPEGAKSAIEKRDKVN